MHNKRGEGNAQIVLGIPTFGKCISRFFLSLKQMSVPRHLKPHLFFVPPPADLGEACNQIVKYAFRVGAKYIYFLEDDVIAPGGALHALLARNVDVVETLCLSKQKPPYPIMFKELGSGPMIDWYDNVGELFQVAGTGMGAMLVKTRVFEQISEPWFEVIDKPTKLWDGTVTARMTQDIYFCKKCTAAGIPVYVDTGVCCGHIDVNTGTLYYFDADQKLPAWKDPDGEAQYAVPAHKHRFAHMLPKNALAETESLLKESSK